VYTVRDAKDSEVFELVDISKLVLAESPTYANMTFDAEKSANYIYGAIAKHDGWFLRVIADENNRIVGGLLGCMETTVFGPDKIAYDVTIMMETAHRGRCVKQLIQVIQEFKQWGIDNGAKLIKLGVSSGINIEKASMFFEHMGFGCIGAIHSFKVGE
jgi:hypothetical protein